MHTYVHMKTNVGLYVVTLVFASILCALADHAIARRWSTWSLKWWNQGSVCVLITAAYIFFPKKAAIGSQVLFGAILAGIFIFNTVQQRAYSGLILIAASVCLILYFLAEAFEIAFTQLRSREPDRFETSARELLDDIRRHRIEFYEGREWLVIGLVIALTMMSDFKRLYIPGLDEPLRPRWIRLLFNLLFTTVMVVWVAQSPSKELALEDPVRWLRYCRVIWNPLKRVGKLMKNAEFFAPGSLMKQFLKKYVFPPRDITTLHTSEDAFFHTGLKRYGYALHNLEDKINVYPDGSCTLTQTGLFYIVCGNRTRFARWIGFDAPIKEGSPGSPDLKWNVKAFLVPNFKDEIGAVLNRSLDEIFNDTSSLGEDVQIGLSCSTGFGRPAGYDSTSDGGE
jgi:hypothetical protein